MNKIIEKIVEPTKIEVGSTFLLKIKVDDSIETREVQGTIIYINDSANSRIVRLKILGNSIQDGTPTPTNPIEIESAGDNGYITEIISNSDNTQSQEFTIPCQQPMRSIGEIRDCFVKENRVWYEKHNIASVILDGSEIWGRIPDFNCFYCNSPVLTGAKLPINYNTVPELRCSHFKPESYNNLWKTDGTDNSIGLNTDGTSNPRIHMTGFSLLADFKTWLTNNNVEIIYVLNTPNYIQCTQEQIQALENIAQSRTYEPITNIYSTDETPAYLDLIYYKKEE